MWTKQKPNLSHVRIFRSTAYKHVLKEHSTKFSNRATKTILVGYQDNSPNYRLYCSSSKKVAIAKHVTFNENCVEDAEERVAPDEEVFFPMFYQETEEDGEEADAAEDGPGEPLNEEEANNQLEEAEPAPLGAVPSPPPRRLRDRERIKRPARFNANFASYNVSDTYQEDISSTDANNWQAAISRELEAHQRNNTWEIIPREAGMRTIDSKWVFKVSQNNADDNPRFKARLCARGFMQREGIDFTETFSPVVRYNSLRVLLSFVAYDDLEMISFDVCAAFLYGELKEKILMEVPEGIDVQKGVIGSVRGSRVMCVS